MTQRTHDVFLSYAHHDAGLADFVRQALCDAGLSVFHVAGNSTGEPFSDAAQSALVESRALVVILTPFSVNSININIEIGAAMAWRKPVYVLTDQMATDAVPSHIQRLRVHSIDEVNNVASALLKESRPFSDEDRQLLAQVYAEFQVPADELLSQPDSLDAVARTFSARHGRNVTGERLMQELLRLRKQGILPRIRKAASA